MKVDDMPTWHYSELPPLRPGSRHHDDWEVYRREVARLLAERREGQFVLIVDQQIVGFWPNYQEAVQVGKRLGKADPFVTEIREHEPILRSGYSQLCRN